MVELAKKLSKDILYVQGAGGNLSWKKDGVLWVKASGKWMANLEMENSFVAVDLELAQNVEDVKLLSHLGVTKEGSILKPSIETSLHAVMPQRFVIHLHHVKSIVELVGFNSKKRLCDLPGLKNWGFIEYQQPGYQLCQKVKRYLSQNPNCDRLFLANHGIVVGSDTVKGIEEKLIALDGALGTIQKEQQIVHYDPDFAFLGTNFRMPNGVEYRQSKSTVFHYLVRDVSLLSRLRNNWPLYPDHVVFLGKIPSIVEPSELRSRKVYFPVTERLPFLFVPHHGVLERVDIQQSEVEQLQCYYEVISRILPGEKLVTLSEKEVDKLLNWDAEKYRLRITPEN